MSNKELRVYIMLSVFLCVQYLFSSQIQIVNIARSVQNYYIEHLYCSRKAYKFAVYALCG